ASPQQQATGLQWPVERSAPSTFGIAAASVPQDQDLAGLQRLERPSAMLLDGQRAAAVGTGPFRSRADRCQEAREVSRPPATEAPFLILRGHLETDSRRPCTVPVNKL